MIDVHKAKIIADELSVLDDAQAAAAEQLIVGELAGKTPGQVGKLAAQAMVTVDPDGAANANIEQCAGTYKKSRAFPGHTIGWHQWTAPSGRSYTQGPMRYPA